jgi:hypothetical protein
MEALTSGRGGLPRYQDLGQFRCAAIGLRNVNGLGGGSVEIRNAGPADAGRLIDVLNAQGRLRQFFPVYTEADFGPSGQLLAGLEWKDVFLAVRSGEIIGVMAAWDQRAFRRWRISGYATWLRMARAPLNLAARFRRMPLLPEPGMPLRYFFLSLVCIRDDDVDVFSALLGEVMRQREQGYDFFVAGLHERDPLVRRLMAYPHFPLHSRLYAVAWDNGVEAVRDLDPALAPYLEPGSL